MQPPFQRLAVLGPRSILCAARGPQILTFTADGQHLSSWTHPSARPAATEASNNGTADTTGDVEMQGDEPPAKKRRVGADQEAATPESEAKQDTPKPEQPVNGKGQRKQRAPLAKQEHQFIILLVPTEDGSHVVAVSGQDKALWVFEHDGNGLLKELSQRIMPKRPSSIDVTNDGQTIVCADKFGDVYSLPLLYGQTLVGDAEETPEAPSTQPSSSHGKLRVVSKKGANELTVHSKRNLRALEEQRRHQEQAKDKPKDGPAFEHDLLLGHVSMLTSILSVKLENRQYLLTADRDEHIRISRGIPQAHIIEAFCLGHTSFINALCIPESRPELLVSAGGDKELFVWKWQAGQLLAKVDLLVHVQKIAAGHSQIAVSQLYTYLNVINKETQVLAICEEVPGIFVFKLQQDSLVFEQAIETSGSPLDITVIQKENGAQVMVVGVDPKDSTRSLLAYGQDAATSTWNSQSIYAFEPEESASAVNLEVSREDLDRLLYTVGNLRKTDMDEAGEGDGEASTPAQPQVTEPRTPAVEVA